MKIINEVELNGDLRASLLTPESSSGLGVVVLAGSSGRVDVARTKLFCAKWWVALALRCGPFERGTPLGKEIVLSRVSGTGRKVDRYPDCGPLRIGQFDPMASMRRNVKVIPWP
jgi:hypothetical protein